MIMLAVGSIIIGLSTVGVAIGIGRVLADFTPGRRTRGLARWWARCWRWRHRLGPNRESHSFNEPVIAQEQIRQMRTIARAVAKVGDRPTPAEFAAAPLYGYTMVDRLLKDLDDAGGR